MEPPAAAGAGYIMANSRMSQTELNAAISRSSGLIAMASATGKQAVAEMSKHPLSSGQAKAQVERHHREADRAWKAAGGSDLLPRAFPTE